MSIALIGHNRPHEDGIIRAASFSDLFFNYQHDNHAAAVAKAAAGGLEGIDSVAALRLDAEDFIATLATATGYTLDADELVADYLSRE